MPTASINNVASVKYFLKRCFTSRKFVEYREARGFALKMGEGVSMLEEMLEAGHAAQCVELAEYTMKLADKACLSMDDSDGHMTPIFECIEEIHRIACERSAIDPITLANGLYKQVTAASFCQFWYCLDTHKATLGVEGRDHFRKLIEAGWAKIPSRNLGKQANPHSFQIDYDQLNHDYEEEKKLHRSVITHFMKLFAEQSGNVDAKVAVLERDLRYTSQLAHISRLYREAGRLNDALKWSLKGLAMTPDRLDQQLVKETLQTYTALNRIDDAIDLAWTNWSKNPGLENYKILQETSQLTNSWSLWRERAHEMIFKNLASETADTDQSKPPLPRWTTPRYGASALLVNVLLWEQNLEEAWKIAQEHGCTDNQLQTLARYREEIAPLEAVPIYQRFVASGLSVRIPTEYPNIAEHVEHIGRLLVKAGEHSSFITYLAELRLKHKRLRSFMKALEEREGINDLIESN